MEKMILVDSCCNLPASFYSENSHLIDMVSMPVHLGEMNFPDDHGKTMSYDEFYDHLRAGKVPSTSQISPNDFYEKFKAMHESGKEIISISFSSGMSGTFGNSVLAKDLFLDDYPEAKVTLIDSFCASTGYGVLVMNAVEVLKADPQIDLESFIKEYRLRVNHFFTVDDLNFLKNGGRIPPALAAVGTLLNLKPMMDVDPEGKLRQRDKVRGRKKAYRQFITTISDKYDPELSPVIIGHGNCQKDAEKLKSMITEELGYDNIIISEESPTIGSHVGPGLLVIGFMGKTRG